MPGFRSRPPASLYVAGPFAMGYTEFYNFLIRLYGLSLGMSAAFSSPRGPSPPPCGTHRAPGSAGMRLQPIARPSPPGPGQRRRQFSRFCARTRSHRRLGVGSRSFHFGSVVAPEPRVGIVDPVQPSTPGALRGENALATPSVPFAAILFGKYRCAWLPRHFLGLTRDEPARIGERGEKHARLCPAAPHP